KLAREFLELCGNFVELAHYWAIESDFRESLVDLAIPPRGSSPASAKPRPDRLSVDGPSQIGNDRRGIVDLVRGADPARVFTRRGEALEVVGLSIISRELYAVVVVTPIGDGEDCIKNVCAELVADSLLQHLAAETIPYTVFDHIVQDAGDTLVVVPAVPREDYRDVRGMGEVGKLRSLSHLTIVVLRREGESMIDDVGIAGGSHFLIVANQLRSISSPC